MSQSLSSRAGETPQETLSGIRATDNKGALLPKEAESSLRQIAKAAIQGGGKQGSAAVEIGIHEARLSAKLGDGTISLKELERLGIAWAVSFAEDILRQHGHLASPQARARQKVREARQCLDEITQFIEQAS